MPRARRQGPLTAVITTFILDPMTKTLTAIGNSLGLIIDRPILELLKIDKDTPLEIETDGKSLTIRPQTKQERSARVRASAKKMMGAHEKALRKLAK